MPKPVANLSGFVLAAIVCLLCSACATQPTAADGSKPERSPADPWEPLNRTIYGFNGALDMVTLKPAAIVYRVAVPKFVRLGVNNFSKNLRSPLHIINHFLQGKFADGFRQTGRFVMNTTFGIGGLMDVATGAGLEQKREDFGQTLAVWGVPDGPYVVIPFLASSTLRDAIMLPLDFLADPLLHYNDSSVRDKVYLVRAIDLRARLLKFEALLMKDAYDPYIRVREAYLQRRKYMIYDGNPPEDEDLYEDFPDPDEDF